MPDRETYVTLPHREVDHYAEAKRGAQQEADRYASLQVEAQKLTDRIELVHGLLYELIQAGIDQGCVKYGSGFQDDDDLQNWAGYIVAKLGELDA